MSLQKKLASRILKSGLKRIKIIPGNEKEISEAITKFDIKGLIKKNLIKKVQKKGVSRVRANKIRKQKQKGRKKGKGSRKGKANARSNKKRNWINKIRAQRKIINALKKNKTVTSEVYKTLYKKSKGGFFRSVNHLKLYLNENKLAKNEK